MSRRPMTIKGKAQLESELKNLTQVKRPEVIKSIEYARGLGDLSENADYDAAKEQQGLIEARISEISDRIANAEVIDPSQIQSDRITFGAHIVVEDESGKRSDYQIVGEDEADVIQKKISIRSPLARGMIGKKKNDVVEVKTPSKEQTYSIIDFYFK